MGRVSSLVDSVGYFLPSTRAFLASKYDLGDVERELSAQVERALRSGLKITFIDAHMGMAWATPQLREVMERVAKKYGFGISTYSVNRITRYGAWRRPRRSQRCSSISQRRRATA